jgi:hypothetical protein
MEMVGEPVPTRRPPVNDEGLVVFWVQVPSGIIATAILTVFLRRSVRR